MAANLTSAPDAGGLPDVSRPGPAEHAMAHAAAGILIAGDHADMRSYLHDLLASGYTVEAVADGVQALEAIRRGRPDLVICDVMMPRLDGFGLLRALRADEALAKIPILLLSARAGEESRLEGLQAGADDYLVKPFSARELLARVEASLILARVRGEFERRMAADLEAMTRLRALAEICAKADLLKCLEAILETALAITGADKGNLQLLERSSGVLRIAAQRGFERPFLEFFSSVQEGEATACGNAMRRARRTVVPDVAQSELFAGTAARNVLLEAGVRAVQSTPLVSSLGRVLGMVSTHFSRPHEPSERDLQLLDLLGRQAADYLESRAAEEEMRSSELRFQTVLDASPAALVLLSAVRDRSGAVVDFKWSYLNKPAQEVIYQHLGNPAQQLIGRHVSELLPHVWESSDLFDSFVRAIQTGTLQRIESASGGAGFSATYLNLAAPFEDGVLVWFIDVTAQKRAEQKLLEQDRRKNEFLAMLAHELRSPLAPIRNANELLARLVSVPDARISRAIDVTRRQVTQLSRLVDDLLDVSRVTQGRIELQRRAVEVSHIVTLAVETVQSLMSEKRQRLSVVNSANFGMWVDADPARLTQCVVNVLTNAAKYTDPGGEICLSTHAGGDSVTIEVSDTGVGIAPELLPQVFDLFVQGERALDRSQGGLGVGLAVTKRLLEMHQGTISARSPGLGGGSTFAIRLPLNKRPPTSEAGPDAPEAAAVRVLIVDDNQDSADSLAALLRLEAHEAQAVYSARQALVQAALFKPDIVLLDIGLPEMNGYELAQQLRQRPELRGTRLVALTGYGQREDRRRAQAAGFDAYLIKPVSLTRLADTLAGFAGKPRR